MNNQKWNRLKLEYSQARKLPKHLKHAVVISREKLKGEVW